MIGYVLGVTKVGGSYINIITLRIILYCSVKSLYNKLK